MKKVKTIETNAVSQKTIAAIFCIAVLSRLLILFSGALILRLNGDNKSIVEFIAQAGDAYHYNVLAEHGYFFTGEFAKDIVFYPLMPYLMKLLHVVFRSYTVSGLIISYVSFGVATVYLYLLMKLDYANDKAVDAILLLFMAPYGMFFVSVHTESLFLMLSVMTLYYARRENWIAAAAAGFFTALSKSQGMLLFVPVVYELILCSVRDKKFDKRGLSSLLIPAGFGVYLCLNKIFQGSFFAFIEHQANPPWYNSATWVSNSLSTSYSTGIANFSLSMILYWPQIALFFVAVAFILVGLYKKVRTSYLAFMGVYLLLTYFQSWMLSGSRYITSCIVMYVVMAAVDNKFAKYLTYLVSGGLCIYYMFLWLSGYAIM